MTADERAWLIAELAHDEAQADPDGADVHSLRDVLQSGRVWTAALIWFALMASAYGISEDAVYQARRRIRERLQELIARQVRAEDGVVDEP